MILIFGLVACLSDAPPVDPTGTPLAVAAVDAAPPRIIDAEVGCDVDASTWLFRATTDAWTAGGWVWLTDGDYVEKTRMPSVGAARDGSSDELALELSIKIDFREATGTAFACSADPNGVLFVLDLQGEIADCRGWGPDPTVWDVIGEGGCPTPLPE